MWVSLLSARIRMTFCTLMTIVTTGALPISAVGGASLLYWFNLPSSATFIDPTNSGHVMQGKAIYAYSCAACHGAKLQGQPRWRERLANGRLPAPPHDDTGHTWHHPDAVLLDRKSTRLNSSH